MAAVSLIPPGGDIYFKYTNMVGFFAQDDPTTDPISFDYASTNLGLLNVSYPSDQTVDPTGSLAQWQRFEAFITKLNADAPAGTSYKLFYLGRHGQGWHNVEEALVGTALWDCYWSRLDGDGNISWIDAELTELGISQARVANSFWKFAMTNSKIPLPESYYVSPLQRCLETAHYTFEDLELPVDKPYNPLIKELFREDLGVHTCDKRSTKSQIQARWPRYTFEKNFSEQDPMWNPDYRESESHHINRMLHLLDDIFTHDTKTFISGSSHSGSITALLAAVGHRIFPLQTGGVIPLFLKAEMQAGSRPNGKIDPPWKPEICPPPAPGGGFNALNQVVL